MRITTILAVVFAAASVKAAQPPVYLPVDGGWQIHLSGDPVSAPVATPGIGIVAGDARLHRRPLYPPADRSMIWTEAELAQLPRVSFRPLVVAYNEPRFLFDYHAAGGLLGHLYIGYVEGDTGKWLHQWTVLDVRYVDGRMEYAVQDPAFPGVTMTLSAVALANSAGLVVHVAANGAPDGATLVWGYGGASAFFTNYAMDSKEFRFTPEQCAKDRFVVENGRFALHRKFDKTDVVTNEVFSAWRKLPEWEAVIQSGSSFAGQCGFGDPARFDLGPLQLTQNAEWAAGHAEKGNCVALQSAPIHEGKCDGYIVVGMGGKIVDNLQDPARAYEAAIARNTEIAGRVVVKTPDPYLNAAATMMAFATDGTWGDIATVHGGWSWRFAYLGWRTCYGPMAYGWDERVKKYVQNHATMGVVKEGDDAGGIGSMLEYDPGVFYNMNEVYFDHVRQYFDYTNDIALMGEIFPVLEGILQWEDRRLQPDNENLYESALNTWISDSHWYIGGQCAQASAYMLNANFFMANLASRLGKDPKPFLEKAQRIRDAMEKVLWMPKEGVFAEYRDTRGNKLLHPEPELPTIYHSAEFGAADPIQIRQMLFWADEHLRHDITPNGGNIVWSSNWFPNHGREYTHSTYEVAYGEEMNLALTNYMVGRADDGYALIKGALCGIFNGPTPGGLSCHAYSDGRQRANDEFADAISMWDRAVIEGLFGIMPKRPDGYIQVTPQFPRDWNEASIKTPNFSYRWSRSSESISLAWESPRETAVRFRVPCPLGDVTSDVPITVQPGFDGTVLAFADIPPATKGELVLHIAPTTVTIPERSTVKQGTAWTLAGVKSAAFVDPQSVLKDATIKDGALAGTVACDPGDRLLFVRVDAGNASTWLPVPLAVQSATPAVARVWSAPNAGDHDLARWIPIDLTAVYNDTVVDAPRHVQDRAPAPAMPASQVNFNYWKDHFRDTHHGGRIETLSDAAWRAKVGADGIAWTRDGIPFKSPKDGNNIGIVTVTGGFEAKRSFNVGESGKTLYLMISGITFPAQSHVPNLRVSLHYGDGNTESKDLVSPFDINDCWATWCGRYHDCAANGFENLGGRHGVAGSADVADMTKPVEVDTEAHLVAFPLQEGKTLASVDVEAVANDVIFGVMGATILR